jgi:hypothetical protein
MKSRFPAALLSGLLFLPPALHAAPVPAQFRGCVSSGWCKFWIEPRDSHEDPVHRVRPLGIPEMRGNDAVSVGVRDRLNALMSSFVHQHKRVVLYGLRQAGDGTWTAHITVNEAPLEDDPALQELAARRRTGD